MKQFYILTDEDLDISDRCETENAYKDLREEYLKLKENKNEC